MSVVFSAHIARVGWSLSGTVVASPRMIGARTRPAICSSWLIQPLLQVAQTALTVVWNGLLVWRYSLDRFSHPDPAAAGWPVRPMRSSQSGSTCSLVIVPLAPQKTQAVAMPGSLHHRDPSYARARSSGSRARPTRPTTVLGGRVRVAQGSMVPFRRIPFIPVHRPDIAVVDVRLPPTFTDEGLRAVLEARTLVPGLPVLVCPSTSSSSTPGSCWPTAVAVWV